MRACKKNPCLSLPKVPYEIGAKVVVNIAPAFVNESGVIISYDSFDYDYIVKTAEGKVPCWHEEVSVTIEIRKENAREKLRKLMRRT